MQHTRMNVYLRGVNTMKMRYMYVFASHASPSRQIIDIWCPSIFVSYHRGYLRDKGKLYTRELIWPAIRELEDDLGIDVWTGMMTRPTAANIEILKESIAKSTVVVVLLSDAYINAPHCQREYLAAVRTGKFIVPVLLPFHTPPDGGPNCGWTGTRDARFGDWWRDADEVLNPTLRWQSCELWGELQPGQSFLISRGNHSSACRHVEATGIPTRAFPSTFRRYQTFSAWT